jgi:protein kinase A
MAVMNHPFVLKLHGTWQDANQLYMFMEIVQGGELWSLLYVVVVVVAVVT